MLMNCLGSLYGAESPEEMEEAVAKYITADEEYKGGNYWYTYEWVRKRGQVDRRIVDAVHEAWRTHPDDARTDQRIVELLLRLDRDASEYEPL